MWGHDVKLLMQILHFSGCFINEDAYTSQYSWQTDKFLVNGHVSCYTNCCVFLQITFFKKLSVFKKKKNCAFVESKTVEISKITITILSHLFVCFFPRNLVIQLSMGCKMLSQNNFSNMPQNVNSGMEKSD